MSNSSGMLPEGGVLRQVLFCLLFSLGCVSKPVEEGTVDADPVAYEPPDTDDGGGMGGGTESGGDGGGGPVDDTGRDQGGDDDGDDGPDPDAVDCDRPVELTPIDECVMDELECDSDRPVLSTTAGAPSNWGELEYTRWTCIIPDHPYDGPETVFYFTHPGTGYVNIQLHAPCEELDLIAVRWPYWAEEDSCPTSESTLSQCEGSDTRGDDDITLYETAEVDYLIVVDGPEGEETNFTLYADCSSK